MAVPERMERKFGRAARPRAEAQLAPWRRALFILLVVLAVLTLTGCPGSRPPKPPPGGVAPRAAEEVAPKAGDQGSSRVSEVLRDEGPHEAHAGTEASDQQNDQRRYPSPPRPR
jgi:hypothetical protein